VGDPLGGKSPVARIALEEGIGATESAPSAPELRS
jgi:hypothetical protein